MKSPQKFDLASASSNAQMQKITNGSPAKCLMCEVIRQTLRNPIDDERVYQNWLRGRKMTKKLRGELWNLQLIHTENEKKRLSAIFKTMKWVRTPFEREFFFVADAE